MLSKIFSNLVAAALLCGAAMAAQASSFTLPSLNGPEGPNDGRFWVDINNDGKDDYCLLLDPNGNSQIACYLSNGQGLDNAPKYYGQIGATVAEGLRWIDQNGDGQVDLCKVSERDGGFFVECRRGPFFQPEVDSPVGPVHGKYIAIFGLRRTGVEKRSDFVFADLNNDGITEYCALLKGSREPNRIECTLAGTGSFAPMPAWVVAVPDSDIEDLRRGGFYDVNGDGNQDFCFVANNVIRCLLGSASGPFTGGEWRSTDLGSGNQHQGAAFIDINNDGKTDYCRVTENNYGRRLMCRLSTGAGWSAFDTGTTDTDVGWWEARWWVDINGDGLPDYCRAIDGGHPAQGQDYNAINRLSCRLASGDSSLFVDRDIVLDNVNFGTATSARGFCDVFGAGVSTLCRATVQQEIDQGSQICQERPNGGTHCYSPMRTVHGLMVGIEGQPLPQPPLLTRFSDGVGAETRIGYVPGSSTRVYYRSGFGEPNKYLERNGSRIALPIKPLVFETRAWREGTDQKLTGNARYYYKDLRYSPKLGAQGFAERWMLTEGSNAIEHHAYYQGLGNFESSIKGDYREMGQLRYQQRFAMIGVLPSQVPGSEMGTAQGRILGNIAAAPNLDALGSGYALTQRTTYTLGDTSPAVNPRVRVPVKTVTERWDIGSAGERIPLPRQEIKTSIDFYGNVTRLEEETRDESTGLVYRKVTDNVYGQDNLATWTLGRLTRSTVTSTAPSAAQQLAAVPGTNAGTSPRASLVSSPLPPVGQKPSPNQISPAALAAILQLLLED
ncbi:UNVERIFIED_ORG: VCBS repeat-containing protein [Shinella sp. XGS7]|nr:VCBS repeat-containing protein [Shinella sp. XGS7]